jgi:hypothetical protein
LFHNDLDNEATIIFLKWLICYYIGPAMCLKFACHRPTKILIIYNKCIQIFMGAGNHLYVGFEVFTTVSMKNSVFRVVALCSLVDVNQRFRGHTASDETPWWRRQYDLRNVG